MKTEVRLELSNPIPFTTEENYSHLGIEVSIVEGKLVSLQTIVEHASGVGHSEIVSKARSAVVPLLTLIEYGYGLPVSIAAVHTHEIEPDSEVSIGLGYVKVGMALVRQVPMPPAVILSNLTEATRLQIDWFVIGQNSTSVIDRIKNLYKVLEQEKRLTADSTRYAPPTEATYLRHAVSHPHLDNPKVADYLQQNIGSSEIDPKNESHIRFLEGKVPLLQSEAQDVLARKVPKWW
jgi:hypothetical protein